MSERRSRLESLSRLAAAYGRHQLRRVRPGRRSGAGGYGRVRALYAADGLLPLTAEERAQMPAMSRCINCGICDLVAGRLGAASLPDLSSAYLRPLPLLAVVGADLNGEADLAAAARACPTGVPLPELAATIKRLAAAT